MDDYEIQSCSDAMLLHNIRCAENVLGNPAKFPKADMAALQERWAVMVAEATGRALVEVTLPTLPTMRD